MKTMNNTLKRPNIDISKLKHLKTVDELFDEKYGAEGTATRKEFNAKAEAWYFAELLKEERKAQKLTQKQLADKIGRKREFISQLERGDVDMQLSTFLNISRALGLQFGLIP